MTESEDPDCLDFLKLKHLLCPCVTDAKTITKLLLPLKRLFAQDAQKSFSTPASCKHTAKLHDLCARVREKPHFHWEWSPVKKKKTSFISFQCIFLFYHKTRYTTLQLVSMTCNHPNQWAGGYHAAHFAMITDTSQNDVTVTENNVYQ